MSSVNPLEKTLPLQPIDPHRRDHRDRKPLPKTPSPQEAHDLPDQADGEPPHLDEFA